MLSILPAIIIAATITITTGLIIYLVVAAIVGLVAEFITGWRLPFGFIGAIIAALVGIWLLTNVVQLNISGDPVVYGVPIIKALLGAIILVALWHLLTSRAWRPRRRYSRRYRDRDRY
ncbi:MAG: GlsB/YeaQ/YmgE family stress response membrane protein [Ktedonobacteraceae bacterium]